MNKEPLPSLLFSWERIIQTSCKQIRYYLISIKPAEHVSELNKNHVLKHCNRKCTPDIKATCVPKFLLLDFAIYSNVNELQEIKHSVLRVITSLRGEQK